MILHVIRRELAARWILVPAAIVVGALAMIAIQSIGHVRGDADGIMNGTWVATLVISTIVGMALLGEELSNSRLSFYFARPFAPSTIFGGKLVAGVLLALFMQIAILVLVALALPELSWRGSALAQRDVLSVGGERVLSTIGCTLLGMAASIALGSKTRWFIVDALGITVVGILGTWFVLRLEPHPGWLTAESLRSPGEKALLHSLAFAVAAGGLGIATARALGRGRTDRMRAHRTMSTTLWPIIVPAVVVLIFVGEQTVPRIPEPPVLALPVVPTVESAIAGDDTPTPYLLLVDESPTLRLGAAASWTQLDAQRVRVSNPAPRELARTFLESRYLEGTSDELSVASIPMFDNQIIQLLLAQQAALADPKVRERMQRMANNAPREVPWQIGDLHKVLALASITANRGRTVSREWGYPHRLSRVRGLGRAPMLLASPTLRVTDTLLETLATMRPSIGVMHAGKIRPLRFDYDAYGAPNCQSEDWIEVRVSSSTFVVEAVPDTPIEIAEIGSLAAAIEGARRGRGVAACAPVDVLFDPDITMQQLVDLLVVLDRAGVRRIGIGRTPGVLDLALRGRRIPSTRLKENYHHPHQYDGRNVGLIVRQQLKVNRCYDDALVDHPNLSGVVRVTFVVGSNDRPAALAATGVDPSLADCVASAFHELAFPQSTQRKQYSSRRALQLYEFEIAFRP